VTEDPVVARLRRTTSLAALVFEQAERLGERPFLWSRFKGAWHSMGWREVGERVLALAGGLRALGVTAGDRIVLVAENRPDWLVADCAILCTGAISVPAYTTNTAADHRHILSNSGAKGVIVSNVALCLKVLSEADGLPFLEWVVLMDAPKGSDIPSDLGRGRPVHLLFETMSRGRAHHSEILAQAGVIKRTDPACIIHTSGSTGSPKGVTLSHGAILSNLEGSCLLLHELHPGEGDTFLSFLPLSHAYERTAGQYLPIALGAKIHYVESAAQVPGALVEVRPTLMAAVPRLFEVIHQRILSEVERGTPFSRRLFRRTLTLGRMRYGRGGSLPLLLRVEDALLEYLVRSRVKARFGGRLRAVISGGAPLNSEIGLFFTALGIPLLQGYGLTEAAPVVSCNPPGRPDHDTVGVPLPGVEVKLAEDGEILVRGELVMSGYWNDPAASAEVLKDGWLLTGDVGGIDDKGYLFITERKKDLLKSSGGDQISPQRVESALEMQAEIAQAAIFGDGRSHPIAILVPETGRLKEWAAAHAINPEDTASNPDFRQTLARAVNRANGGLAPPERIRRFLVAGEPFSVENRQLTPTLKVRRHQIRHAYAEQIEALYRVSSEEDS
jgi:long-chain acyl-CoA synthetase